MSPQFRLLFFGDSLQCRLQWTSLQFTDFATGCNTKLDFWDMTDIGIGIVGGGYMGMRTLLHTPVGAVFNTTLRRNSAPLLQIPLKAQNGISGLRL